MTQVHEMQATDDEVLADLHAWLEENWDPDLTVADLGALRELLDKRRGVPAPLAPTATH